MFEIIRYYHSIRQKFLEMLSFRAFFPSLSRTACNGTSLARPPHVQAKTTETSVPVRVTSPLSLVLQYESTAKCILCQ